VLRNSMRLVQSNSDGNFSLTTSVGIKILSYAILSHTWEADDQVLTFQDFMNGTGRLLTVHIPRLIE
jgi:hypothetical protein